MGVLRKPRWVRGAEAKEKRVAARKQRQKVAKAKVGFNRAKSRFSKPYVQGPSGAWGKVPWMQRVKRRAKTILVHAGIGAIIGAGAATLGRRVVMNMRPVKPEAERAVKAPAEQKAAKKPVMPRELSPEMKANDFLLFRQEQAKRFGIVLTERAVPFKPSASLMREFKKEISETCKALGTDRTLVYSILRHECGFNPNAKSPKNARGPGQLVNIQIKQLENLGFTVSNPYSIGQSVEGCARTLKWMEENLKFNGSRKAFLSLPREKQLNMLFTAYNSGLARSNKLGPNYVSDYTKAVWSIYRKNFERNPFK